MAHNEIHFHAQQTIGEWGRLGAWVEYCTVYWSLRVTDWMTDWLIVSDDDWMFNWRLVQAEGVIDYIWLTNWLTICLNDWKADGLTLTEWGD